jgi:quercetin dioxygenase-like cupin family protein
MRAVAPAGPDEVRQGAPSKRRPAAPTAGRRRDYRPNAALIARISSIVRRSRTMLGVNAPVGMVNMTASVGRARVPIFGLVANVAKSVGGRVSDRTPTVAGVRPPRPPGQTARAGACGGLACRSPGVDGPGRARGAPPHRSARHGDHVPSGRGRRSVLLGPGDTSTFLVTGAQSGDASFSMRAIVPPGGGPPSHTHAVTDETFSVIDGALSFFLKDHWIQAGPGDFVNIPRGELHHFQTTLERASDLTRPVPDNIDEVGRRCADAAPRYGMEFVLTT